MFEIVIPVENFSRCWKVRLRNQIRFSQILKLKIFERRRRLRENDGENTKHCKYKSQGLQNAQEEDQNVSAVKYE